MPMMRVEWFFKDGRVRFKEVHWLVNAANHTEAEAQAEPLTTARERLLGGTDIRITQIRISDDEIYRDSFVDTSMNREAVADGVNVREFAANVPWSVVRLRMEGTHLHRRTAYLSGCPRALFTDPIGPTLSGARRFLSNFDDWVNILRFGDWGFRALAKEGEQFDQIGPGGPVPVVVGRINVLDTVVTPDNTIEMFSPAHGLATGDVVRFKKFQTLPRRSQLRGHVQVIVPKQEDGSPDPDYFLLRGLTGPLTVLRNGYLLKCGYFVQKYTDVIVRGETHRPRGVTGPGAMQGRAVRRPR